MKSLKNTLFLKGIAAIGIVLFSLPASAQIGKDKWNVTIEAALPSGLSSPVFRKYLNGLISIQPKLQYRFTDNLYLAIGPKYSYYTISEFKVPVKMRGGMHTFGGFLEFGYTKWQSETFGIQFGMKAGVAEQVFITDSTRVHGIQRVTSIYIEPTISLVIASDEAVAYRWIVGYNISGYDFKPYEIGVQTNGGFSHKDINKPAQSLIIGFGFTYYFGNKRSFDVLDEE